MSTARPDSYRHALATANTWLADISAALNTDDRHFSRRALRAWLHTLRDRLGADSVAKFGAQLPELMRGTYYDGWDPSHVPIKYGPDEYVQRFAWEARIPITEVGWVAPAVTAALAGRFSSGQLDEALAALPADIRGLVQGATTTPGPRPPRRRADGDRIASLQEQVSTLAEAVRSLARGLENHQLTGVDTEKVARGAQLADEILMTMRK